VTESSSDERKGLERELHDHLRGEAAEDPHYNSNKRFYAISHLNVDFVHDWLRKRIRGARVLDYCSGNGDFSVWLAQNGAEAHGVDISPVSVENARTRAEQLGIGEKASFHVMDAEALDFPDDHFDVAVVHGVLHHLDLDRAYRELARVLAPGGAVIATEALKHNPFFMRYRRRTPELRSAWETDHILGRPEIDGAKQYFESVRVLRFFHLTTLAAVPLRDHRWFRPVLGVLNAIDAVLLRLPLLQWQAWMGVFELSKPKVSGRSEEA